MSEAGTLERLVLFAGEALAKLARRLEPAAFADYVYELGLRLPDGLIAGPVATRLAAVQTAADRIGPALEPLRNAIEAPGGGDVPTIIVAGADLAAKVAATAQALAELGAALRQAAASVADPALRAQVEQFGEALASRIFSRLLLDRLDQLSVQAAPLLAVLGLAEDRMNPGTVGDPAREPFYERLIHFDRIAGIASDPRRHLEDHFGWGAADFDASEWLERVKRWFEIAKWRRHVGRG